ncbi:MAG: hypothetical protein KC502_20010 [Myxococcales bacterium]|nr:hypothetical protein [Myxococcales bacterium]
MSGPFEVALTSFPAGRAEHIERVVHKHNRGLSHQECHAFIKSVAAGNAKVIATYEEEHSADNVVAELAYHDAKAEVRAPAAAAE